MSHSNENKPDAIESQDGNNLIDQFFSSQGTTIPSDLKAVLLQLWVVQMLVNRH
jgi:GTP-binding protein Era